jgi:hypothetical protein
MQQKLYDIVIVGIIILQVHFKDIYFIYLISVLYSFDIPIQYQLKGALQLKKVEANRRVIPNSTLIVTLFLIIALGTECNVPLPASLYIRAV